MIKLYHCRGARSLRALWTLEELALRYEMIALPFPPRRHCPEFLEINPLGTIPFLIDGAVRMTESAAICLYLATRDGPSELTPTAADPEYASFLNWLFYSDATLTFPLTIVLRYRRLEAGPEGRKAADDYERWFFGRLRVVEAALESREWLCGQQFTVADIAIAYALYLAEEFAGLESGFGPAVRDYLSRAKKREGFQRALAADSRAPAW